jgi:phospholipase C
VSRRRSRPTTALATINDVEHIVILTQENRPFDHPLAMSYFTRDDIAYQFALADAFTVLGRLIEEVCR